MEYKLYEFNPSQDVINLQTKYTLFKRVENILFYTAVEGGFDADLMTRAINLLFARHDCLRIRFVKKGGKTMQCFDPERTIGKIPFKKFDSWADREAFYKSFRRKRADIFKGKVLEVVFAENPDAQQGIFFKVSHYVADTYGIGVLVSDLFAVYRALASSEELPPEPGSFEKVLAKELEYKNNAELKARDEAFFKEYYEHNHPAAPMYCGVHGDHSDEWLKVKRKGKFAMPYYFVRCDTDGMMFDIPSTVGTASRKWCEENGISMSNFFFQCFSLATSLLNGKAANMTPLMLLDCRGTLAERKSAGTKVQPLSVYVSLDYGKGFLDNIRTAYLEQQELYKHTRLTYLEVEALQHKLWGHSMLSQTYGFCYSFIPMKNPEGVKMQVLSNGKCALTTYVALMYDVETDLIRVVYDVQTMLTTPAILADFHNKFMEVIEKVIKDSSTPLEILFK